MMRSFMLYSVLAPVLSVAILPRHSSLELFSVRGSSMAPGLEQGDLVIVAKGGGVRLGDVIVFEVRELFNFLKKNLEKNLLW